MKESKRLTTTAGAPDGDNENSLTAGPRGPVLMQDYQRIGGFKKYCVDGPRG